MSEHVLKEIHSAMKNGARLSIGRNNYGGIKLKVSKGPFGLLQQRYRITSADLERLFSTVKLRNVAA